MNLDIEILKGLKQGLGIFLFFGLIFGVYGSFHYASQIIPGIFTGDYVFNGSLNVTDNFCLGGVCQNSWPIGNIGDITGVISGTGLTGGSSSGDATLSIDSSYTQRRVSSSCAVGQSIRAIGVDGSVTCEIDTDTNTNAGTICGAGQYLDGDGTCNTVIVESKLFYDSGFFNIGAGSSYSLNSDIISDNIIIIAQFKVKSSKNGFIAGEILDITNLHGFINDVYAKKGIIIKKSSTTINIVTGSSTVISEIRGDTGGSLNNALLISDVQLRIMVKEM